VKYELNLYKLFRRNSVSEFVKCTYSSVSGSDIEDTILKHAWRRKETPTDYSTVDE
jgi:hypothetical protein